MRVILTKLSSTRHRFELVRDEGARECADLHRGYAFDRHHDRDTDAGQHVRHS